MKHTRAYTIGQLVAALERLDAFDDFDRAYHQLSMSPQHPSLALAITNASETRTGREYLAPLMATLDADAFDTQFNLPEQSAFGLGYWHQKRALETGIPIPSERPAEPDLDARWEVRIDPDLKEWALAHGGSRLVRDLLRKARAAAL